MGKDGQSSKSNKDSKSQKKKSTSSKKPNGTPATGTSGKSGKGSKAVTNSKGASAKGGATKSSKASSGNGGGGSSSYSQSKSAPSSKVSKGGKQRSPGGRKPAAPSTSTKAQQKKSPKSVKSGKKSTAASTSSSASAYVSATSDDSAAEVKAAKAKNKATVDQEEGGGGVEYGTAEEKASSTSYETEEDGGGSEVESKVADKKSKHKEKPPPPPAEKPLEFTKPTINQMKKEKKDKPLSMAERITSREFEQLFDEINELNSGVQMLKHSYASIIKSLVAIQTRRGKKKSVKEVQKKVAEATGGKVTFLTTLSTCNPNELRTKSVLENTDKYDIENFLNPGTRDETFNMLFDEIDDLTKRFEPMRPFYDDRGRFRRDSYDGQEDVKMDRAMYNEFKVWCKKLSDIVDDIARNYNDDLLNMFRLN